MVKRMIKLLFGIDPVLLDAEQRTKQLQATINSEHEWLLLCRPTAGAEIKCDRNNQIYVKKE